MAQFTPPTVNPAADSAALLRRLAFFLLFMILPVSAIIARRALVIVVPFAIILLILAVTLDGNYRPLGRGLKRFLLSPGTLLGILALSWGALSLLWTPFPAAATERILNAVGTFAMIVAGYLALPERMRSSNLYLLPIGVGGAALLALFAEAAIFQSSQLIDIDNIFERGLFVLVLLFWPALAWLRSRRREVPALLLAGTTATVLLLAPQKTALWAFAFGALTYVITTIAPRFGSTLTAWVTAGLIALAPLIPFVLRPVEHLLFSPSIGQSLEMCRNLILAEPVRLITGRGFETALRGRMVGLLDPNAPMSMLFEIWYELGIVGAFAVAATIFVAVRRISDRHTALAPGIVAGFTSAYLFACMGVGTAQSWWLTALASTILIFVAVARGQFRTKRPSIFLVRA